ncbi:uncharacterized protein JCM6883_005759 [Sporobolomyces salmoneus]|uniref:uncharacterized protein n=1 Tax=Sporobolomyces salmoneus TaxID=183962 RepID=UPI00316E0BB0
MTSRLPARLLRTSNLPLVAPRARPSTSTIVKPKNVRFSSSSTSRYPTLETPPKRGIKIGYVFSALAFLGISATSYGLYQFYSTFTVYPDSATHPIRSKLRAAIRAESTGEYERASTFFQQAYDLCLDLYRTEPSKGDEGLIKLSGIAVRWGGMWESQGQLDKAIQVYDTGFQPIADHISSVSASGGGPSYELVKRGAGIALKLGDLWTLLGTSNPSLMREAQSEAERYYTWSVQELMRLSLSPEQKEKVRQEMENQSNPQLPKEVEQSKESEEEKGLELPGWMGEVELVAAFERLGDLYSRQGKIELAQPLLQQAIATLYPPPKKGSNDQTPPPISRRCHAATLMNNLSSSLVTAPSPSAQAIEASSRWARQALNVSNSCKREAEKARGNSKVVIPLREREEVECELTAVVACYNLGKLAEMSKDTISAEQWFVRSEKLASQLGLRDAVLQARESLRRLKHLTTTK